MIKVNFIFSLGTLVNNEKNISVGAKTVMELLDELCEKYQNLKSVIMVDEKISEKINIIINDELITGDNLGNLQLQGGDQVVFVPTIVGG